jgi:hypothetical protein
MPAAIDLDAVGEVVQAGVGDAVRARGGGRAGRRRRGGGGGDGDIGGGGRRPAWGFGRGCVVGGVGERGGEE